MMRGVENSERTVRGRFHSCSTLFVPATRFVIDTVRARPRKPHALSVSPSELDLCGAFCMGAQGA
jgi:hypothetical protein